ncbi:MAG: DUF4249 domain-containing protein [Tannerellaceae bacterium]|jgi:hypothetical protein|nr:DUF4249 domain-containing protein [Tannerellaceae bacterium]
MKKRFVNISLLVVVIGLHACYYDLDLEKYRPAPTVVLNAVASPDTLIMARVCLTTFFADSSIFKDIEDAEVKLYVNKAYREQLKWEKAGGIYVSSITPQASDEIKLEVNSSYGNVWAEDIVPYKVNIEKIETAGRKIKGPESIYANPDGSYTIEDSELYVITYSITFKDNPADTNYYCIRIEDDNPLLPVGTVDYSDEPVFIEQNSTINSLFSGTIEGQGGRTFSDKLFNGKTYTLMITETVNSTFYDYYADILNRKILLYSLSKSYYNYLTSLLNIDENSIEYYLSEYGLYEPVKTFSNIQGGAGILATSQVDIKTVDLKELFPE